MNYKKEKKRHISLDVVKGITVTLVVFWHLLLLSKSSTFHPSSYYYSINEVLKIIRMPLFFFVSGVVMSHSYNIDWTTFFRKKLIQLIWVYALWSLIYHIAWRRPPDILIKTVYDSQIHLWFIWALIIYRILGKLLIDKKIYVITITFLINILSINDFPSAFWSELSKHQKDLISYSFFYFIATWNGEYLINFIKKFPFKLFFLCSIILIISIPMNNYILILIFGLLFGLATGEILAIRPSLIQKIFTFIGKSSLEIFVIHYALVRPVCYVLGGIPGAADWAPPFATMLIVGISILCRKLSDPFAPWLFQAPRWLFYIFDSITQQGLRSTKK